MVIRKVLIAGNVITEAAPLAVKAVEEVAAGEYIIEGNPLNESQPLPVKVMGGMVTSNPPVGMHKVYNIYAKKVGEEYHFMMELETIAEE